VTTYLITGAAGYLGTTLARQVEAAGGEVRRLPRADLHRREAIARAIDGVDVVFHLAAQTSVYVAEAEPIADVAANLLPMLHLLEGCRARGPGIKVIFASSATVHGLAGPTEPDDPITIYDLHKLVAERYLRQYVAAGHVSGATLRLANVYGPGPAGAPDRGVINAMVRRALGGENLTVYGSGEWQRDYVYIDDVARAFLMTAARAEELAGASFVVGTGIGHSVAEAFHRVARLVGARIGREITVTHVEPPASLSPIEQRSFVADPGPLHAATGFASEVALDDGLRRTIEYHGG
jgi:UDP-glucose 4-epimerase